MEELIFAALVMMAVVVSVGWSMILTLGADWTSGGFKSIPWEHLSGKVDANAVLGDSRPPL